MEENLQISGFNWFLNKEKGRPCLVAGTAPTIDGFSFNKFKGICLTMGDGPIRLDKYFQPNYWVNANPVFPIPENDFEIINSYKDSVFIFSDSAAYSDKKFDLDRVKNLIKIPWFSFDQRHFGGVICKTGYSWCCQMVKIFPHRQTIQEYIQSEFEVAEHYGTGSTVAIHALAFSLIMGCNPIFIQGVELPLYVKDYNYSKNNKADALILKTQETSLRKLKYLIRSFLVRIKLVNKLSDFGNSKEDIVKDFSYLAAVAKKNNQKIYILSKTSLLATIDGFEVISNEEAEKFF